MKLSRFLSNSLSKASMCVGGKRFQIKLNNHHINPTKVEMVNDEKVIADKDGSTDSIIDWELRPGGMLVQKRNVLLGADNSSGPLIRIKVSYGLHQHYVVIAANATIGDIKWILAQETGLQPHEQRLIYQGKERDDNEFLHIVGIMDMTKVILVEDPASKEKKLQEMKSSQTITQACQVVEQVRQQVDKVANQIFILDQVLPKSGSKVFNREMIILLEELLLHQLLQLNDIHVEGEAQVQRWIEAKRVQNLAQHLEVLKVQHQNPICGLIQ